MVRLSEVLVTKSLWANDIYKVLSETLKKEMMPKTTLIAFQKKITNEGRNEQNRLHTTVRTLSKLRYNVNKKNLHATGE